MFVFNRRFYWKIYKYDFLLITVYKIFKTEYTKNKVNCGVRLINNETIKNENVA